MNFVEVTISSNTCVIFGKLECPYTKAAKELLESLHVTETVYIDQLDTEAEIKEYLVGKTGQKSVPNIFINGIQIGGNSDLQAMHQNGTLLSLIQQQPAEIPTDFKDEIPGFSPSIGEELVLYDNLLAYFPARARLVMHEKGFPFKHVLIDIFNGQSLKPEFVRLNPNAALPVLKHGSKLINQSREICDYINNLDGKPLGGQDVDHGLVKEWVDLIAEWDGNMYMASYAPEGAKKVLGLLNEFKIKFAKARASEVPELAEVYMKKIEQLSHIDTETEIHENRLELDQIMDKAEVALSQHPYLCGNAYTLADLLLTPMVYRVFAAGQNCLKDRKNISEWYNRMKSRPSYLKTFKSAYVQKNPAVAILPAIVPAMVCKLTGNC
jgi:glutaredoxin 3